jgi:uncharacterized membrane protein
MFKVSWHQVFALALAAFFVAGALTNIFAPASIYQEYLQWGYPPWFHFVTGSLELTSAVLLARVQTRLWGSALGCIVMLAALATVTLHGEYGHGVAPLVAAGLSILVGCIAWRKRVSGQAMTYSPPDVSQRPLGAPLSVTAQHRTGRRSIWRRC